MTTEGPLIPETYPPDHRSGFVAVIGRPNVGKSTLMNAFLGQKIAIVSEKPQTTRNRILGILTRPDAQVIFVDTPGIHRPLHKLGEAMVRVARRAIPDADVICFMVDLAEPPTPEDREVAQLLKEGQAQNTILVMNKLDLVAVEELPRRQDAYRQLGPFAAEIAISALHGQNRDDLLQMIIARLPLGPRYYPEDQITDQRERDIAAELIREQALKHLHQEVPYSLAVEVEQFKERPDGKTYIEATIYVERESQKRIVIGEKGSMLKTIGQGAREEIEAMLGVPVYLELWVKVFKDWRQKEEALRALGYLPPRGRR